MSLFLMSALIFGISAAAMAVGVIFDRAPLGGGCGSVNGCEGCERRCKRRAGETEP
jgi:hypothetical protein